MNTHSLNLENRPKNVLQIGVLLFKLDVDCRMKRVVTSSLPRYLTKGCTMFTPRHDMFWKCTAT